MAATSPKPAGAGNLFTQKLGPLPVWAWLGLAAAGLYLWRARQASQTAAASSGQTGTSPAELTAQQQGYSGADVASWLQQLSAQVSALGAGNSGTNASPAVSPGNTQTSAANQTAPAAPRGGVLIHGTGPRPGGLDNWLAHLTPAQRAELQGPSASWRNLPGLTPEYANVLAHLTPAQQRIVATQPSAAWAKIPALARA